MLQNILKPFWKGCTDLGGEAGSFGFFIYFLISHPLSDSGATPFCTIANV
jgi:hypothetical protein